MTFRRGAALTTAASLGFADNADTGPTAGNGFYRRWPDDLALLQDIGITDLRITLDWARLQPKPGTLDGDWSERFTQILQAAGAIDLRTWITLHDGSVPRWFDNEGGFDDVDALARWWPRWVEQAAETFGDLAQGWIPFASIPADALRAPWSDTWGILGGGGAPVVASLGDVASIDLVEGRCDLLGVRLGAEHDDPEEDERDVTPDAALDADAGRWGRRLREHADALDVPVTVAGFDTGSVEGTVAGRIVERLVAVLDEAVDDGVDLHSCFLEPAIAGPESTIGILDRDRSTTAVAAAYLPA